MLKRFKPLQYLLLATLLFTPAPALATYQIRDVLTVDGERYDIENVPLQTDFPGDVEVLWEQIELQYRLCTGNYRGYQAFWEVIEGDLLRG